LALATHIPPSVWAEEGDQAIATAFALLEDQADVIAQAPAKAQEKARALEQARGG
jgi:hypothetical protein